MADVAGMLCGGSECANSYNQLVSGFYLEQKHDPGLVHILARLLYGRSGQHLYADDAPSPA